jgi:hypothetical protein
MNSNIIFTGLCTVDLQFFTDRYPNENEKIKASQFEMSAGGPATNAACTCAHLGSKATLLTAFGENHFSDVVREELEGAGVVWADVAAGQHRQPTFASVISNTQNGLRTIFLFSALGHRKIFYSIRRSSSWEFSPAGGGRGWKIPKFTSRNCLLLIITDTISILPPMPMIFGKI